jgi:pantoate--beta-alanine ligase
MIIFKEASGIGKYLQKKREMGAGIGFVPTMGALHRGHMTLVEASVKAANLTVCSIFVNPTQFNDPADFAKYPVTLEKDLQMLADTGADIVFLPEVTEIYPEGMKQGVNYPLGDLETVLEGKYRPGHFQGVCQVVHRLLGIIRPDILYMGQKDYQQCMVVQHLIDLYKIPVRLETCSTIREETGLAMSSRNMRLSVDDRFRAAEIYRTLRYIKKQLQPGSLTDIKQQATTKLTRSGFKVDYLEICHARKLTLLENWDGASPIVALVAAFLGEVRLIDNLVLTQ